MANVSVSSLSFFSCGLLILADVCASTNYFKAPMLFLDGRGNLLTRSFLFMNKKLCVLGCGCCAEVPLMQSLASRNLVMLVREYANIGAFEPTAGEHGAGDEKKNRLIWELVVPHQLLARLAFSEEPIARFRRHAMYPLTDRFCLCKSTSPGPDGKLCGGDAAAAAAKAVVVVDGPWMAWEDDDRTPVIPDCDVAWIDTTTTTTSST